MYKIRAVRIIHFMTEEGEREMKERTAAVHLSPVWAYWLCFHITTSVNKSVFSAVFRAARFGSQDSSVCI